MSQIAEPCILVIFGARGDLTRRKLVPSLFRLWKDGLLSNQFVVIGNGRKEAGDDLFRTEMKKALLEQTEETVPSEPVTDRKIDDFISRFYYVSGDSMDSLTYGQIRDRIVELSGEWQIPQNTLFYLATPPDLFAQIPKQLARVGLFNEEKGWKRLVLEKPFGSDLESAKALNRLLLELMKETQIYRIDHYLGKETVQNIMVMRFANGIFEPIWNRRYIDSVQITVAETLGAEGRGAYYDQAGALRDMVPNHLFQLVSLIGMEAPNSFRADDVRDEKVKVLKAIKPFTHESVLFHTVRGQYAEGEIEDETVPGYRTEPGVNAQSRTETFAALELEIDNWRWAGVPFYLRTGKRLRRRVTELAIQFKKAPFQLFRDIHCAEPSANQFTLEIQPEEKMALEFATKTPGPDVNLAPANFEFHYGKAFGKSKSTGYETLLYDCMNGDPTLFQRADQIEAAWSAVTPILDVWSALSPREFPNYRAGSFGPQAADELLKRSGRAWRKRDAQAASFPGSAAQLRSVRKSGAA